MAVIPIRSYFRKTKTGTQLVVPAKNTIAKTKKRLTNEKEQTKNDKETKND